MRRPRTATALALALVLVGGLQLLGSQNYAAQLQADVSVLPASRAAWLPAAAAVSAAAGLALLAAAVGLILVRRWGWWLALAAPPLAAAARWALRLALERSAYEAATRPVDAGLTVAALAVLWLALAAPGVRRRYWGTDRKG